MDITPSSALFRQSRIGLLEKAFTARGVPKDCRNATNFSDRVGVVSRRVQTRGVDVTQSWRR